MKQGWKQWAGAAFLAGTSLVATPVSARDLVAAEIHPPGHVIVQSEELLARRLAELTKGELTIQLKHSAQLGNENQSWENVRKGTVDVVRINLGGMVKDIAAARCVEVVTVKTQIKGLLRKFGCTRTKEIVEMIHELGVEHLF